MGKKLLYIVIIITVVSFILPCGAFAAAGTGMDFVIDPGSGKYFPIPLTYYTDKVISYLGEAAGYMNEPDDLFIDRNGFLYVADTGNNRIIKMDKAGNALGIFPGPEDKPLNKPSGVFVDADGDIYVADSGNQRILHMSPAGEFVEEFGKPESDLLGKDFTYFPSKIYINSTGYIYVLKGNQLLTLDAYNQFRGYVGATKVDFDLRLLLIRIFASKEQKKRLDRKDPPSYLNFMLDDAGMIYVTVLSKTDKNPIRKLNSVGKNIFVDDEDLGFGAKASTKGTIVGKNFLDISVSKSGIISVIEQDTNFIYQYDQEGFMLTVFGGKGSVKGAFELPSSIAEDADGNIYVLDKSRNNIQVMKPTGFIKNVQKAVELYGEGKYGEALTAWGDVLKMDAGYSLAHRGIGKALLKQEQWKDAMEEFKTGDFKIEYSQAFSEYRHDLFRRYFGWVVLIAAGLIVLIAKFVLFLKKTSDRIVESSFSERGGER